MKKRFLKNALITFTFIIAVTNFSFYLADTLTGKPIFANSLKVLGFCPAPTIAAVTIQKAPPAISGNGSTFVPEENIEATTPEGATGPQGAKGEKGDTGATGATGPQGTAGEKGDTGPQGPRGAEGTTVCQAPVNLYSLPGDLIPATDNLYSLGNSTNRWKGLHLGPGTLYIQDVTTGLQAGITVNAGTLLLDGADSLRIGNIRLTKKGIESVLSDQDITIGNISDRGYALFARGIKFPDGTIQTTAMLQGIKGDTGPQGEKGEKGDKGDTGATGPQGIKGDTGAAGANGGSGSTGAQGPQGIQGIQGVPGTMSAYYGNFYSTATQTNAGASTVNAMTFNGTPDAVGVTIESDSRIKVANAGTYNLQFSAQLDKTDSGNDPVDIWLAKNGTNVPWSNTRLLLYGNNAQHVAAWNFFITLAANDYVQLYWSSPDADMRLYAEPDQTLPTRPGIPSVIATIALVTS